MVRRSSACLLLEQRVTLMEKETKEAVNRIEGSVHCMKSDLDKRITQLFNHQSTFVSPETVREIKFQWKLITALTGLLCTIISGSVVGLVVHAIA